VVQATLQAELDLQLRNNGRQESLLAPIVEMMKHRFARPEFSGEVSPGCTGSQDPQDRIEGLPKIRGRPTGASWFRKQVLNALPLLIREPMPRHDNSSSDVRVKNQLEVCHNGENG